jgi:hypothetical protein
MQTVPHLLVLALFLPPNNGRQVKSWQLCIYFHSPQAVVAAELLLRLLSLPLTEIVHFSIPFYDIVGTEGLTSKNIVNNYQLEDMEDFGRGMLTSAFLQSFSMDGYAQKYSIESETSKGSDEPSMQNICDG